jgi:hypothetical protein
MISLGVFPLHAFLRSRPEIVARFFEFLFSFLTESSKLSFYPFEPGRGIRETGIVKAGASSLNLGYAPLKVKDLERSNFGSIVFAICKYDCCLVVILLSEND